ncbi:MFS transporter [Asaia bogorensis]|uniref:MFS transporter n=1 Tax=Asaia bogorensis TaxID=91915 RepID=UPI000EFD7861|nr:MFS transporter [Asaia bogorensis]
MAGGTFVGGARSATDTLPDIEPQTAFGRFISWAGIPPIMIWGFIGTLLFMIGDGVESGYLSPYLVSLGFQEHDVAGLFTIYGLTAAVSAWASGALSDMWGSRKVMLVGLAIWILFQIGFLGFALPSKSWTLITLFYGLRGFGYPLFAFGFLVWVVNTAPVQKLGSAVGWFWFCFTAGLPTLGTTIAGVLLPIIGGYATLWVALSFVVFGGALALLGMNRVPRVETGNKGAIKTLFMSLAIGWQRPKVGIGCIVRAINTSAEFGFLVFMPLYFTHTLGFTMGQWLAVLQAIFISNIFFNLFLGIISDKLSWRYTVLIMGGIGSTLSTMALYFAPTLLGPDHLFIVMIAGAFYGMTLAGYVPLSALMPYLAPENKAAAMSLLNLGAGASVWIGPAIVYIFEPAFGVFGVMVVYSIIYFLSAVLTYFLKLDPEVEAHLHSTRASAKGFSH